MLDSYRAYRRLGMDRRSAALWLWRMLQIRIRSALLN
jgi:hypothetical protein